uniref:Protein kinase domain-containing protein n=1 Tax=Meloidogyne hapla TaxID=6305 RepID=A0A1I8BYU5_MELHA
MANGKEKGVAERSVAKGTSGQQQEDQGRGQQQADQGRGQQQQEDANTNTEMISHLVPMEAIALSIGTVIGGEGHRKWRVLSRLGSGAFGAVFLVQEEGKKDNRYALKAERLSAQVQMLAVEVQVYQALMSGEGTTLEGQKRRHPLLIDKGAWNNQYNYLVMSLVGPSLEVSKREIKPANFSIGHGDTGVIYILDFGMARCFVRPDGVLKRPRAGNIGFRGTAKYASRIGHKHKELCRGDDVESWFYMACELLRGKLPWHRIDDEARIRDMKIEALRPGKVGEAKPKGTNTDTKAKTETKTKAEPKPKTETKTEPKTKMEPKTKTETKPKEDPKTKTETKPKEDPKAKTETKPEKDPKDPRRMLLGGCPKQFANILELVAPLRYYDEPPYDGIAELIAAAIKRTNVQTYPLDWQEGQNT